MKEQEPVTTNPEKSSIRTIIGRLLRRPIVRHNLLPNSFIYGINDLNPDHTSKRSLLPRSYIYPRKEIKEEK